MTTHPLSGVYAAAVTPIKEDNSIALEEIPNYLAYLARRGCHGALLLGTTGEGPSFSTKERLAIYKAALRVREVHPNFRLLAGTGIPSLEETIYLTKSAFDLGFNGAVVLPPYYFHQATEEGLVNWFQTLIKRAVPEDGYLLGYHFPIQSGVPIPLGAISQLRRSYPERFSGLKDSTPNAEYAFQMGTNIDSDTLILVGNGKLLMDALSAGASGCITAMANLHSPTLREIWDGHQNGVTVKNAHKFITAQREKLDSYRPFPASIKVLLASHHGFPRWKVRSPLTPLSKETESKLIQDMATAH
jgi:4-hydroxy-tetrahydrodipicolinate synthase